MMEGHGRLFDVVPIAAGEGLSLKNAAGVTFVCTATSAGTATVTVAQTFSGSYSAPTGFAPVSNYYTNTATAGTAHWADASQAAGNTVPVAANGATSFYIDGADLPAGYAYVKVSGSGVLVTAILHDLFQQEDPAKLPIVAA